MPPGRQLAPLLHDFRATREKWAHGKRKNLVDGLAAGAGDRRRRPGDGGCDVPFDSGPVPSGKDRHQRRVTTQRLGLLVIRLIEGAKPAKDVGGLPDREPQVSELDRNVFKAEQWTRVSLVRGERPITQVERGQRDAGLNAALHFEQLEVHVHGIGKLGLSLFQRAKLGDLSRFGPARARRSSCSVGHPADHTSHER